VTDLVHHHFPPERPRRDVTDVHAFASAEGAAVAAGAGLPPDAPVAYPRGFRSENRRSVDNRRLGAYLIDSVIIGAVLLASGAGLGYGPWYYLVYPALCLSYFFVCESLTGQTIGKRAMKLRVMHIGGGPAGTMAVGGRTVLRLVDAQLGGLVGLCVMILSRGRRQRLGDLATGTIVRRDDRPYTPARRSVMLPLYPAMWIGAAVLMSMWLGLIGTQDPPMRTHLTSDPYLRKVNDVCKRRLEAERRLGNRLTFEQAVGVHEIEFGGISSLPKPPPASRAAYRQVMRLERSGIRRAHRVLAKSAAGDVRGAEAELASLRTFGARMNGRLAELGLPYCAQ
jgi:uncharacterized RDD family membrane protein YckC